MTFLEESWGEREEQIYPKLFGELGPGIYPLSAEPFNRMNATGIDPRWLTHGVFKCPPTGTRHNWANVTSGMSNPWESEKPEDYSGLGVEFLIETTSDDLWAVEVLHTLMAYNLLLAAGHMGDFPTLDYGNRVPLSLSDSIKAMLFVHPINFPMEFTLNSGKVDVLQVVGITQLELDAAKQSSSKSIEELIVRETGGLITSKERLSVV